MHSPSTLVRVLAALALSSALVACGSTASTPDTGGGGTDAGTDAARVADAGTDAGAVPMDAAADTSVILDAGGDGGPDAFVSDAGTDAPIVACTAHTFVVTSDGASYAIDGHALNPTLSLCPGVTYTFDLTAVSTFHPMELLAGLTSVAAFPGGMTTSYTTPAAAPFPDSYRCSIHGFGGLVTVH